MTSPKQSGAGLRGQAVGQTAIATVGQEGRGLTYRGYSITDLAAYARFEEVAYLLLYGKLPNQAELTGYTARLKQWRGLPQPLREVLEQIPASANPMDVLRTGCSFLGILEPETDFSQQQDIADRLLATFPDQPRHNFFGSWQERALRPSMTLGKRSFKYAVRAN